MKLELIYLKNFTKNMESLLKLLFTVEIEPMPSKKLKPDKFQKKDFLVLQFSLKKWRNSAR